ncbi:bacillithiol biosynthesis cysteine-adding enzyme BshC [Cognataquiflexum rubidum]|uniref:bacillithiol biosynthesis cysteine-adding enzyme BshC n=1 Tax=Cognataquiflexum rubidum TaxID=2922273 RepID=UPI001F12FA45|nr:bacillithiol biosynthesis cysteine-adding enzyme BshC [Cognataquiflexum rubidum]MCH6232763.1 bacillithiol biosynthesis cysteine-adding enzyme BshC [Cognataquiflexum rubidum]
MIKSTVDPDCTGQFSALFLDYIHQKPEIFPFYNQFPKIENFQKLIEGKKFKDAHRNVLVETLSHQYQGLKDNEIATQQIQSLADSNTFTVTTGHQLNLFTGPLYFIYKIVSTVNLADRLNQAYPDNHFVPVYWMASEDHDFDEINYFKLDGKKYQWKTAQTGAVGDFDLDESFKAFFKEVSGFVPDFFNDAYQSSSTLSEAVRKYVHHMFGDKGLLIVDANEAAFKRIFTPVIQEDLFLNTPKNLADSQTKKLEDLGYKSQIFPREINFFYMEKGIRERIEKSGDVFNVLNTEISFTEKEMMDLISVHPERFSPNVVLRPLYQEMILPNLAYLGGPAEVVYWLQMKGIFDHFEIPFPALMPRNFAVVVDQATEKKIQKLGLSDELLFQSVAEWKKDFISGNASMDIRLSQEKEALELIFEKSGKTATELEKSLGNAFEAAKVRALKILDHLGQKVRKAEERRWDIQIKQREAIFQYMNPGGSPQERVENFMRFYLQDNNFVDQIQEVFDPFDFSYMILRLDHG